MQLRVALLLGSALLGVTSPALAAPQRLGPEAARAFRDAYQALTRGDYAQAEAGFRSLASTPSLLSDYALYYLGESLVRSGTQTEARQVFQAVQDQYPGSRLVPQALLKVAELSAPREAEAFYRRYLERFAAEIPQVRLKLAQVIEDDHRDFGKSQLPRSE